ncbi:hypothetical protein ZIOFF_039008 [Zingiber officinale]|uniref:Reticulon domain-containing protein n=1 Tax=Zingiber officinale TaxID=94328 RepID=A0A8J5G3S9_ZINOF|nr:hypothetical protein ZIOFF_039008 [Zingiber officinale]
MQACSRRRALSRSSRAGGNGGGGGGARLRKSQSDSAASVEKRKKSNFAAADKEESGGSSAVQLKKSLSDLPISRTDQREMFVDKEMDKNGEKPRSAEEEEEQIPVSVEDEEKNQSLESLLSVDVVEKEQIVLVADRNENAAMNLESEAQPPPPHEDLVMWKDASRSALVFGFGTFLLLSSSYAEEVHFSSYVGLIYLAFVFLCKSFIRRGEEQSQCDESCNVVEEEDAIWLLKMLLPYINDLLLKLKTLFSGDPSTTLKLAGPKSQIEEEKSDCFDLACCSVFWGLHRSKSLLFLLFSSDKTWSVGFFMLVVAVKLYQQSAAENSSSRKEEGEEQKEGQEDSMAGQSQLLKLH